jgi:hypothetical protein
MVLEHGVDHASQWAAIGSIAAKIGCTAETSRGWVRQAERDQGLRVGPSSECRPGRLRGAASRGLDRFAATPPSCRTQASILAPFPTQARKDCFGHVHKAQWISMARRLSAGRPQNKSHSDHAGISKKKISENQITAQGRMNSAISPAQNITMVVPFRSRNMTFSGAIAVMNHRSTATPARRLKDPTGCGFLHGSDPLVRF